MCTILEDCYGCIIQRAITINRCFDTGDAATQKEVSGNSHANHIVCLPCSADRQINVHGGGRRAEGGSWVMISRHAQHANQQLTVTTGGSLGITPAALISMVMGDPIATRRVAPP